LYRALRFITSKVVLVKGGGEREPIRCGDTALAVPGDQAVTFPLRVGQRAGREGSHAPAGTSERWRAALGLAGYAGLRLGEIRALTWGDVDFESSTVTVRGSALPDGTLKAPKTEAGARTIPLLPALRRLLATWKLLSPHKRLGDLVVCTADGEHVEERNLRRALDAAKDNAKIEAGEERLSWHSLRHSFASMLATDLELPATTLARLTGHTDAGFTLRVYARDRRDEKTVVEEVLSRAAVAGIGE